MNAFEVLELNPGASEKEIKKAYFKGVREHPPDKEPESFKEIRAAYETLCDSEKRAKAEKLAQLPPEVGKLVEAAESAMKRDDTNEALACLDAVLRIVPDSIAAIELIGNIHSANGKFGLAVKHYENYSARLPENVLLSARLAGAYWQRGWNKKAKAQFINAINRGFLLPDFLEEFNDFCQSENEFELLENTFFSVLERCDGEEGAATAALCIASLYINSVDMSEHYLVSGFGADKLEDYLQKRPEYRNVNFFNELLSNLIDYLDEDIYELTRGLPNLAITMIPDAVRDFDFGHVRYTFEMSAMTRYYLERGILDSGSRAICLYALAIYTREFKERNSYNDSYLPKASFDVFEAQMELIEVFRKHRPSIRTFIDRYPYIWSFMDEFLTKLQSATNLQKFADRHTMAFLRAASPELKKIVKDNLPQEAFEYYQYLSNAPAPVRSEKIPPNSPCPCGSGKKYKKCCGMQA